MNEVVKVCLKNNFEWRKKDYFFLVGMILISGAVFTFLPIHEALGILTFMLLVVKCMMFLSMCSMSPGQGDSFSWKFLQGLPLRKPDLIALIVASGIFAASPFLILLASHWKFLSKAVFETPHSLTHALVNSFLAVILVNIFFLKGHIQYPRKEFQKRNASNQLVKFFRKFLLWSVGLLYLIILLDLVEKKFNIDLTHYIFEAIKFSVDTITSWWSVPILLGTIVVLYFSTLKVWINEKLSYRPNTWNPKKEYSLITASTISIALAFYFVDFKTPDLYEGDIHKLVFQKKVKDIETELKAGVNPNSTNRFGMTPILVAIKEGNIDLVKFLESKGAIFEGAVTNKKSKFYGFDALLFAVTNKDTKILEYLLTKNFKINSMNQVAGLYPLHYAAATCNSRMVDALIQNGAQVNVLNDKGETPLIVSARMKCFAAAVALKEAGASFELADSKGKKAIDLIKGDSNYLQEFRYFLEKNTRVPASAKIK